MFIGESEYTLTNLWDVGIHFKRANYILQYYKRVPIVIGMTNFDEEIVFIV